MKYKVCIEGDNPDYERIIKETDPESAATSFVEALYYAEPFNTDTLVDVYEASPLKKICTIEVEVSFEPIFTSHLKEEY